MASNLDESIDGTETDHRASHTALHKQFNALDDLASGVIPVRSGTADENWGGSATSYLVAKDSGAPAGAPAAGVGLYLATGTGWVYHYTASTWSQAVAYPSHFGILPTGAASVSGAFTITLGGGAGTGSYQRTLTGNATLSFSGWRTTDYHEIVVQFIQDGIGSHTLTWPTVTWTDGAGSTVTAPTMPTSASATMEVAFWTWDAGTTVNAVRLT
jgi:hypothetical protein